jgi:enamine deaminase RidA (YjgF/YER057c/UK114 family)
MRPLSPGSIHPPFAHYSHGVEIAPGSRLVFCSGQLGIGRDGAVPEGVEAQARL